MAMKASDDETANATLEVRLGGGRQPLPHKVWVRVGRDGTVVERSEKRQVDPQSVAHLLGTICDSGLRDIDQERFDAALRAAGEYDMSRRGGTGVYTLTFHCNGEQHSLRLNRPHLYVDSKVPEARDFATVISLLKKLVKQGRN
jgi:hypothetical protein